MESAKVMDRSVEYQDGRWYRLRDAVLNRDNYRCVICGEESGIQCHHHWYVGGRKVWEYDASELSTLCDTHHNQITIAQREFRLSLCKIPPTRFMDVCKSLTSNPSSDKDKCGGIAISGTNDETIGFRLHRLRMLISSLLTLPKESFRVVHSLHDHKGTLQVSWKLFSTLDHRLEIESAWQSLGESEIRHFEIGVS